MEEKKIEITVNEYRDLIETKARSEAFAEFVKHEGYSIGRIVCGAFFGFQVDDYKKGEIKNE